MMLKRVFLVDGEASSLPGIESYCLSPNTYCLCVSLLKGYVSCKKKGFRTLSSSSLWSVIPTLPSSLRFQREDRHIVPGGCLSLKVFTLMWKKVKAQKHIGNKNNILESHESNGVIPILLQCTPKENKLLQEVGFNSSIHWKNRAAARHLISC